MAAMDEARENSDLFPWDCFEILENHYGKRLKGMTKKTLCSMVSDLMKTATDADCTEEIEEAVSDFLA